MHRALAIVASASVLAGLLCGGVTAARGNTSPADFDAFLEAGAHRATFAAFEDHLRGQAVDDVVPPWTLWRQGTDWRAVGEPAFAVPPRSAWGAIVPTLRVLRDEIVPVTGPVEVVSGWRTERYNSRAGGAPGSRHRNFEAVDVVPLRPWLRAALHERLLDVWTARGPQRRLGLGLYGGTRFHVDTHRHRRW